MKLSNKWFIGSFMVTMLIFLTGLFVLVSITSSKAQISHPLYTVSQSSTDTDIAKAAIDYTTGSHALLSGSTQIVFNKKVTVSNLVDYGFGNVAMPVNPPPLHLVIIKGDFDGSAVIPGAKEQFKAAYIGYVFDLNAGSLNMVRVSRNGGLFRIVLNDPSLPDDYKAGSLEVQSTETVPLTPTASSIIPFPNGAVVPGVTMAPQK